MPLDLVGARRGALDTLAASGGVGCTVLPAAARFILRGRTAAVAAAGRAFGVGLPQQACRAASAGERAALWLGPDEWLLVAAEAEGAAVTAALEQAMGDAPHSLVDVSHRQIGIEISGPHAAAILNAGCPLDLDAGAFPVGMCTRTVLAKTEIVLWRTAAQTFRVEVGRSFAAYVQHLLEEVGREFRY